MEKILRPENRLEVKKVVLTEEQLATISKDELLIFTQTADEKGFFDNCPSVKVTCADGKEKTFIPSIRNVKKDKATEVKTREVVYAEQTA